MKKVLRNPLLFGINCMKKKSVSNRHMSFQKLMATTVRDFMMDGILPNVHTRKRGCINKFTWRCCRKDGNTVSDLQGISIHDKKLESTTAI